MSLIAAAAVACGGQSSPDVLDAQHEDCGYDPTADHPNSYFNGNPSLCSWLAGVAAGRDGGLAVSILGPGPDGSLGCIRADYCASYDNVATCRCGHDPPCQAGYTCWSPDEDPVPRCVCSLNE